MWRSWIAGSGRLAQLHDFQHVRASETRSRLGGLSAKLLVQSSNSGPVLGQSDSGEGCKVES